MTRCTLAPSAACLCMYARGIVPLAARKPACTTMSAVTGEAGCKAATGSDHPAYHGSVYAPANSHDEVAVATSPSTRGARVERLAGSQQREQHDDDQRALREQRREVPPTPRRGEPRAHLQHDVPDGPARHDARVRARHRVQRTGDERVRDERERERGRAHLGRGPRPVALPCPHRQRQHRESGRQLDERAGRERPPGRREPVRPREQHRRRGPRARRTHRCARRSRSWR